MQLGTELVCDRTHEFDGQSLPVDIISSGCGVKVHEVTLLQYQYRLALSDGVANAFRRKRRVRAVDVNSHCWGSFLI